MYRELVGLIAQIINDCSQYRYTKFLKHHMHFAPVSPLRIIFAIHEVDQ